MKKFIFVAVILVAALIMPACEEFSDDEFDGDERATQTLSTAPAMYNYIAQNYNSTVGPIAIAKGTLTTTSSKTVYLVTLSGTQMKTNQATGIVNDLQAGFSIQGAYVINIKNAIYSMVPKGSNLVLAGHSLGGMVAQQVAGDGDIKRDYNVVNTVTFGSPLISFIWREGAVQRLGDTSDIVPTLSISSLFAVTATWNIFGLNRENGGYGANVLAAHLESYKRSDVWGRWNAIGYKDKTGKIVIDLATRKQFAAPAGWVKFNY